MLKYNNEYLLSTKFIRIKGQKKSIKIYGNLLCFEQFSMKFSPKLSLMNYQSFIHTLPKTCLLKTADNKIDNRKFTCLTRKKVLLPSQDIYLEITNNKSEPPAFANTCVDLFPFLEYTDCSKIFILSHNHWRILARFQYNFRTQLTTPIFCCESTRIFWQDLHQRLKPSSELCIVPRIFEIVGQSFDNYLSLLKTINNMFFVQ